MNVAHVGVPVSVLWRGPDVARAVDAPVLRDEPDHAAWLAAMDADGVAEADSRFGLDGRIDSQVLADEPVVVLAQSDGWSQVIAPWQPSRHDPRGYPGFVRTSHLEPADPGAGFERTVPAAGQRPDPLAFVEGARAYLGLPYLWGGVSPTALDCSGLVHLVARELGLTVPRDADDQQVACVPVELGAEQPGDLYFFAHPGRTIHHVGIAVGAGRMLHAPGTGTRVVEEEMSQDRKDTLVGAGRLPGLHAGA